MTQTPLTKVQKLFVLTRGVEIITILTVITVIPQMVVSLVFMGIIFTSFFVLGSVIMREPDLDAEEKP